MKTMLAESAIDICQLSLPGVVIFPGMSLPLTVTAEKHLRVFENAWLSGHRVLLTSSSGEPNQKEIGCLVEIQVIHFGDDHIATAVLRGVNRQRFSSVQEAINIGEELQDIYESSKQSERLCKREQLLAAFHAKFPVFAENQLLLPALENELPFGTLCDVLAASCRLNAEDYGRLLAAIDVDQRCELLMEILLRNASPEPESQFPPLFSLI